MSANTPGPWAVYLDVPVDGDICVAQEGFTDGGLVALPIALVDVRDHPMDKGFPARENALANARLIAAAPDLLAALLFIKKYCDMQASKGAPLPSQLTSAVLNAIAKAEGTVVSR